MRFRADIQILRGIAVLAVLLFHLGAPFGSGFLGVDVFFVVSGYLMYKLYGQSHSVGHFYLRRLRRLLPAYFAIVGVTLLACLAITVPSDFAQVGTQAIFAGGFASNIGFWLQNSYFSKGDFNPLLHLWSLGVELQFYLIVPLIMMLFARSRLLTGAVFVGSLALCLLLVTISPKTAFFMMPLRLWQFGLGMAVAALGEQVRPSAAGGFVGLAGLVACLLMPIDGESTSLVYGHPSLGAIAICAATAAVLLFSLPERVVQTTIGRSLWGLGDVSYSLYLVHFPVIVLWNYVPFGGTRLESPGTVDTIGILVVTAVGTLLSYRYIERRGGAAVGRISVPVAMALTALAGLLLPPAQLSSFAPRERMIFGAWTDRADYRCGIVFRITHPGEDFCVFEPVAQKRGTVMLLGDSHADSIKSAFVRAAGRSGLATAFSVSNYPLREAGHGPDWMVRNAKAFGVTRVYLHYARGNLTAELVRDAVEANTAAGLETVVILPTPEADRNVPQAMYYAARGLGPSPVVSRAAAHEFEVALLRELRPVVGNFTAVSALDLFCDDRCDYADPQGRPLYFDAAHLTLTGAHRLLPLFNRILVDGQPR